MRKSSLILDKNSELIRLENNALKLRVELLLSEIDDLVATASASSCTAICLKQRVSYLEDRASRADASYSSTIAAMRLRFSNDICLLREQLSMVSNKLADLESRLLKANQVRSRLKVKNQSLLEELLVLSSEHEKYLDLKRQLLNPLVVLRLFFLSIKSYVFKFFGKPTFRAL